MTVHHRFVAAGVAAIFVHCVDRLELPEPPPVADLEDAYENPTLDLTPATAEAILADYLGLRERLAELDDLGPLVRALVRFDSAVAAGDEDDDGIVELAGVPLRTDAVITLFADCPGWGGETVTDAIELLAVVRASELVPILWGATNDCRLERRRAGLDLAVEVRFGGDVLAYLPTILDRRARPRILYVVLDLDLIEVEGRARPPWSVDLRLVDDRLEARIAAGGEGHVVVYASRGLDVLGVRARNGEWSCNLEERGCAPVESEQQPFSY